MSHQSSPGQHNRTNQLGGVIPPLVTPMHADERVDEESLRGQVERLVAAGIGGLWVNGTTGEFHAMEDAERSEVIAMVAEIYRSNEYGIDLVAQVGAPATRRAVRLAEDAAEAGATALAAITPFYLEYEPRELMAYYGAIKSAVPLPLVVYHLPSMTKTRIPEATMVQMVGDGLVDGVKDSSNDLGWLRAVVDGCRRRGLSIRSFVGGAMLVDSSLLVGASGAMCAIANLVPAHCVALVDAGERGEWEEVRRLQAQLSDLQQHLGLAGRANWAPTVAVLKFCLKELGVIRSDVCASPLEALTLEERRSLESNALPMIASMEHEAGALRSSLSSR
jgi:4-hydroxy-tetrahydrodipicolinate synthase